MLFVATDLSSLMSSQRPAPITALLLPTLLLDGGSSRDNKTDLCVVSLRADDVISTLCVLLASARISRSDSWRDSWCVRLCPANYRWVKQKEARVRLEIRGHPFFTQRDQKFEFFLLCFPFPFTHLFHFLSNKNLAKVSQRKLIWKQTISFHSMFSWFHTFNFETVFESLKFGDVLVWECRTKIVYRQHLVPFLCTRKSEEISKDLLIRFL